MLQNATSLRKSAPGPPDSSAEHVSCTAPATENASLQILFKSFKCPPPAIVLEMLQNPHVLLNFDKVHNPLRLPGKTTPEPPKVAHTCGALYILTSKCASRHNGVHFFDISTSKSGANRCFTGRSESHPSLSLLGFPHCQRCFQEVIPKSSLWWFPPCER